MTRNKRHSHLLKMSAFCLSLITGTPVAANAETVMRMGMSSLPLSLGNPFRTGATPTIYFTPALFDGLTRITRDGTLMPWLAVNWEAVDETTWRIQLRDGVTFSNGRPLTSEAAVFAINYLASEESLPESLRRELPTFVSARTIDELTFEVTTAAPEPLLMRSMTIFPLVDPQHWQRLGREGFSKEPIGTGPFKIVSWSATDAQMTAATSSWRPPQVDRLEVLAIPDRSARIQALQSDRIDFAIEFGPEDGVLIEQSGLKVEKWIAAETAGLSFILTRKPNMPLQDVRVREALNLAVNRAVITEVLLEGATVEATQPAPRSALGHNPDLAKIPYDPDRARALLKEAGYEDGFKIIANVVSGIGAGTSALQVIANDFAAVGVTLEIQSLPIQQFLRFLGRGGWPEEIDAFSMNWPVWPSLDSLRALRLHSCLRREPWYCDERIMPQIDAAMMEWDEEKSITMRQEIMAWYRGQYPAVFLFEAPQFAGLRNNVEGFSMVNQIISFETLRFGP
ncbi:MAG: ABC transporter substrate-binding protein [Rhodospirillaceae bacterium]